MDWQLGLSIMRHVHSLMLNSSPNGVHWSRANHNRRARTLVSDIFCIGPKQAPRYSLSRNLRTGSSSRHSVMIAEDWLAQQELTLGFQIEGC